MITQSVKQTVTEILKSQNFSEKEIIIAIFAYSFFTKVKKKPSKSEIKKDEQTCVNVTNLYNKSFIYGCWITLL